MPVLGDIQPTTRTWGGQYTDFATALAVDGSGNVYVTGYANSFDPGSIFLLKYDSSGTLLFQRRWQGNSRLGDEAYGLAIDKSGNIYVTGYTSATASASLGHQALLLLKFSSSGDLQFERSWGGTDGWYVGYGVATDNQGHVYVTGKVATDLTSLYPGNWAMLLKFDTSAGGLMFNKAWNKLAADSGYPVGNAVAVDNFGYVYVTGSIAVSAAQQEDMYIIKFGFRRRRPSSGELGGSGC